MNERHITILGVIAIFLGAIFILLSTWSTWNNIQEQDSTLSYYINDIPVKLYISLDKIDVYKSRINSYMSSQNTRFTTQEIRPFLINIFEAFQVIEAVELVVLTYQIDEITQREEAYIDEFRIIERGDIIQ